VQLHRVPPPACPVVQLHGTPDTPSGVVTAETAFPPGRHARWWHWLAVWLVAVAVLGQGERFRVDNRFSSPTATLLTYWEALGHDDAEAVSECFAEPSRARPLPGMTWVVPPSRQLGLYSFKVEPINQDEVLATYEVRFVARDALDEERLVISSQLMFVNGGWRIVEPLDEVASPDAAPVRRLIDS
jgi:hypothetical protein